LRKNAAISTEIVITGLVPVIHAFFAAGPGGGRRVDGRIKSGHDEYGWASGRLLWPALLPH
jgi:hypothetical protein